MYIASCSADALCESEAIIFGNLVVNRTVIRKSDFSSEKMKGITHAIQVVPNSRVLW